MKKYTLLILLCIFFINIHSKPTIGIHYIISDQTNWGKGYPVVTYVFPGFPAEIGGIKKFDIITHLNGEDMEGINDLSPFLKENNVVTIKRMGSKKSMQLNISSIQLPENSISEWDEFTRRLYLMGYHYTYLKEALILNPVIEGLNMNVNSDPDTDFSNYYTFDFEYTDIHNPIIEKKLALVVKSQLERLGLKQDKENPDILILLSSYSGTKEQYIPPTQQITTRYQADYNIWQKRYEDRQYIESNEVGNYTKTDYLLTFKIAFLDAKKVKEKTTIPPIIWQGEISQLFPTKQDLELFTQKAFNEMLERNYPIKTDFGRYIKFTIRSYDKKKPDTYYYYKDYFYTGIWFNNKSEKSANSEISYVTPGSPADKAGIKSGDKIFKASYQKSILSTMENYDVFYNETLKTNTITYLVKRGKEKFEIQVHAIRTDF